MMGKSNVNSMIMADAPHVGEVLHELFLAPLEISVTAAAKHLGISRQSLSRLINGQNGISIDMAMRFSKAFGTSTEFWVNLQKQYELSQGLKHYDEIKVKPFKKAA